MAKQYELTGKQVAALRALNEGIVEMSPSEVAVSALLLLDDAREALEKMEEMKLAHSWLPATAVAGERLFEVTGNGRKVYRALAQYKGNPPVGATIRIPREFPSFSEWLSGQKFSSYVQIISDQ